MGWMTFLMDSFVARQTCPPRLTQPHSYATLTNNHLKGRGHRGSLPMSYTII